MLDKTSKKCCAAFEYILFRRCEMNIFSSTKKLLMEHVNILEKNKADYVKDPLRDFTRKRKLSFSDTIMLIISLECGSIRSELLKYFSYSPETVTSSAFVQQRDKLKPEVFQELFYSFSKELSSKKLNGYHFFAVDGSDVLIPLADENDDYTYFGREQQRKYHQIHLNAVYDLLSQHYTAAYIEPRRGHNERNAFHKMFEEHSFPQKSVFVFDRGYEGYPLMAHILNNEQFFVLRVKDKKTGGILKGVKLPETDEFDIPFDKICVKRILAKHKKNPDLYHRVHPTDSPYFLNSSVSEYRLTFRIIRFRLDNGSYECLLTNLPRDEFDAASLKSIYNMRWGIETSFRHLKHSIGLLYFHSKKIESIEQEIWARLILYNYCMAVISQINVTEKIAKHRYKINITNAISICRRFLKTCIDRLFPNIEKLISDVLLPIRHKRSNPRKKRRQQSKNFVYRVL